MGILDGNLIITDGYALNGLVDESGTKFGVGALRFWDAIFTVIKKK